MLLRCILIRPLGIGRGFSLQLSLARARALERALELERALLLYAYSSSLDIREKLNQHSTFDEQAPLSCNLHLHTLTVVSPPVHPWFLPTPRTPLHPYRGSASRSKPLPMSSVITSQYDVQVQHLT